MTGRAKRTRTEAVAKDTRRAPTDREARDIAKAATAFQEGRLEPPEITARIGANGLEVVSPHNNDLGHALTVAAALGVPGGTLSALLQNNLINVQGARTPTTDAEAAAIGRQLQEGLAFVQAVGPASPLESIIAAQMWAMHLSVMNLSRKMNRADQLPQFEAYGKLMNKAARTFATQVDTLQKLRTGGKQTHEVRYVYVDARTQTVVNGAGGGGGAIENLPQPQTKALAHAPLAPLWGTDEAGDALPVASGERAQAVSDAWGNKPRSADRPRKRKLHPRPADK